MVKTPRHPFIRARFPRVLVPVIVALLAAGCLGSKTYYDATDPWDQPGLYDRLSSSGRRDGYEFEYRPVHPLLPYANATLDARWGAGSYGVYDVVHIHAWIQDRPDWAPEQLRLSRDVRVLADPLEGNVSLTGQFDPATPNDARRAAFLAFAANVTDAPDLNAWADAFLAHPASLGGTGPGQGPLAFHILAIDAAHANLTRLVERLGGWEGVQNHVERTGQPPGSWIVGVQHAVKAVTEWDGPHRFELTTNPLGRTQYRHSGPSPADEAELKHHLRATFSDLNLGQPPVDQLRVRHSHGD